MALFLFVLIGIGSTVYKFLFQKKGQPVNGISLKWVKKPSKYINIPKFTA